MKESKYIIRKIIIGVGIALCLMFIRSCNVNASVVLDGTTLTSDNYKYLDYGNRILSFNSGGVYPNFTSYPQYFLITMCSSTEDITAWYVNNDTLKNVNIYNTSYKCMFPNSTYTGGHIVYIYGNYDVTTNCSASLTNCVHNGSLTFYVPEPSSWALLNYQNSNEEISIDYATDTIVSQNQSIIDQNQQIINQNNTIINNGNTTNNKLDDVNQNLDNLNQNLTDETSPNLNGLENAAGWLKPGPVDSIINLPLTLLNNLQTNLGNTCNPVVVNLPYVDKDISLPCISAIYKQIDGLDVWFQGIGVIAAAIILYKYFMYLYNRIDDTLSFRENNMQGYFDDSLWGGM